MADGDLISGDWEVEFGGLLLGGDTAYSFVSAAGLDQPGVLPADRPRLRRHGTLAGDDFLGDREIEMQFEVYGDTAEDFETVVAALGLATIPCVEESPLSFQIPGIAGGGLRQVRARIRRHEVPVNSEWYYRIPIVTLTWVATDPRIYSAVDVVQSVNLPSGNGGLSWPATWPANWGAATDSGSIFIENEGNFGAPWSARIDGPCVNPIVRNVSAGVELGFAITLADGEWLDIDSEHRTVVLNGTASRYYTINVGSRWWDFEPGTTEIAFRASTATAALLTVTSRSAWTK